MPIRMLLPMHADANAISNSNTNAISNSNANAISNANANTNVKSNAMLLLPLILRMRPIN